MYIIYLIYIRSYKKLDVNGERVIHRQVENDRPGEPSPE